MRLKLKGAEWVAIPAEEMSKKRGNYELYLKQFWEDCCWLSTNDKEPRVEFLQALIEILQWLQKKPKFFK